MIKKEVLDAINEQINAESYSAYMYLSMAAYFENMGLPGFANWMKIQYQEESAHALKFMMDRELSQRVFVDPNVAV